jgi:hypothetical protein
MNTKQGDAVALRGEGQFFYWTKRALERAGFEVCDERDSASGCYVEVSEGDGEPSWQIRMGEDTKGYETLYDVVSALKGAAIDKK